MQVTQDILLIDKDLGEGITSTRLICVIKHNFPKLPIIRWTGGYDDNPYMDMLAVSKIKKPNKNNEQEFIEIFEEALKYQELVLSGPMGIFRSLDETTKPDEWRAERREEQLNEIAEIAQLADNDDVQGTTRSWSLSISRSSGTVKHELGHCICDGLLTVEEIRPHLSAIQKVVEKIEKNDDMDERFKTCAEFIKTGNLDELELVQKCY